MSADREKTIPIPPLESNPTDGASDDRTIPVPEFVRRALELGMTGFFTTEQTLRKAFGDAVPQDWVDFFSAQSDRTRQEMTQAVATELARSLERIDVAEALSGLLSGRTIEIHAKIRLTSPDEAQDASDSDERQRP